MILGSGLGIVLSLVFGCLLLALVAELYYLLWWKKLRINDNNNNQETNPDPLEVESGPTKDAAAVEAELMRLQNRLLFTIKEETKEDLESEDGKSKASRKGSRTRSLSDLVMAVDSIDCYNRHGFNPLFEASSPPPKFKFLRDAEEKMYRKLMQESEKEDELRNGSFIRIIVGKNYSNSSSSQVLPLASSPTEIKKPSLH